MLVYFTIMPLVICEAGKLHRLQDSQNIDKAPHSHLHTLICDVKANTRPFDFPI
jgi:hypothetical protein